MAAIGGVGDTIRAKRLGEQLSGEDVLLIYSGGGRGARGWKNWHVIGSGKNGFLRERVYIASFGVGREVHVATRVINHIIASNGSRVVVIGERRYSLFG